MRLERAKSAMMQLFAISLLTQEMSLNVSLLNTELFSAEQPGFGVETHRNCLAHGSVCACRHNVNAWQKISNYSIQKGQNKN